MADPIKARACSLVSDGDTLTIRLVFDDAQGVRQIVEHTYAGEKAVRFANELCRQKDLGAKLAPEVAPAPLVELTEGEAA